MTAGEGDRRRLGVAGLGTVGVGVLELLRDRPGFPACGPGIEVAAVSARSRTRPGGLDVSAFHWFDDPVALAASPDIDIFVELIGGADGPAKAAVEAALKAGKPVVTANKALIAEHGLDLARLAERRGVSLAYEAAVMGGAPAVKLVREALVGDEVTRVAGILNGTCNFILTEMEATGRSFAEVLAEAQRRGFAEADPATDVGGFDAAHKIAILAALAFGAAPNFSAVEIEGIAAIDLLDIALARELGFRIKLIASAARGEDGGARVRVGPMLVPLDHPLAQAGGALNALFVEGRRTGRLFLQGAGAGAGPTAAAVAADLADVVAGGARPVFGRWAETLSPLGRAGVDQGRERVFLRLTVRDRPGVIANISEALAKADVSIDSFLQHPVGATGLVPIVLTTQPASRRALGRAVAHIGALDAVAEPPRAIPLADLADR